MSVTANGAFSARLAELGITLPAIPVPAGSYAPAVRTGNLVFSSGQLALVDGVLTRTGKVGDGEGLVPLEEAQALARTAALNALAAVAALVGGVDQIVRVVKVLGFVSSDPDFRGHPVVINGASDVLGEIFGEAGVHARSAVGVAALPFDSPVEVEIIAEVA